MKSKGKHKNIERNRMESDLFFANLVGITRQHLGLSLHQFGEQFGVSRQAVWTWEQLVKPVPRDVIFLCLRTFYKLNPKQVLTFNP